MRGLSHITTAVIVDQNRTNLIHQNKHIEMQLERKTFKAKVTLLYNSFN